MFLSSQSTPSLRRARTPLSAIRPGEGVNSELTPKTILKFGNVTFRKGISPLGKSYWQARFTVGGRDVRYRVSGDLKQPALKKMAENWMTQAYQEKGHFERRRESPTIETIFGEMLRHTRTLDVTRRERARLAERFMLWLDEKYPGVERWEELRPAMIQAYKLELEAKGLAFDSVRLALAPIKLALRFVAENYPELGRPMPRLKITAPQKQEIDNLEPGEVRALLEWLREHAPDLWPMGCLQALAGLRMLEAAAVRREDVDLERGTLAVMSTAHHRVKTQQSVRVIPLCNEAVEALRFAIASQRIIPPGGELFTNEDGCLWTKCTLTKRWLRARRHLAAKPETKIRSNGRALPVNQNGIGLARVAQVPAKRLRSSFGTMASRLGVPDHLIQRYIGHRPTSTFGKHYRKIGLADLELVSERMNDWRKLVEADAVRQNSGKMELAQDVSR
jgi:integrase